MKVIIIFLAVASMATSQSLPRTVRMPLGRVRGKTELFQGIPVDSFLGVPFAQPPVGELRFKKPQPVQNWRGFLTATNMPPACIQYVAYPYPWYDFQDGKSEDCLYLNIFSRTSPLPITKKAVMFWIFGGGYTVGSNRKDVYNAVALAARGDVLVVTINYRLAAFGFLTSGTDDAPGNVGMYDMVEALKWVNKYISYFGGDPNQVTVFGESAGSISTGIISVSPLTKGLFKRIILESGSPAWLFAENNSQSIDLSQRLAKAVGCASDGNTIQDNPSEVVSCLRDVDARNLSRTLASFHPTSARSFVPMYGDDLSPVKPRVALINGDFQNVDVLIGNVRDEGAFQITTANPDVFGFFGEKNTYINKSYGASIISGTVSSTISDPDDVVSYYLDDVDDNDLETIRRQVYTASGDYSLLCPTVYFADRYSDEGNKVYYYFLVHRPSNSPWAPWMGVVHYDDVQFVFGQPQRHPTDYTPQEVSLSDRMIRIWSNFAKTGKPDNSWPLYSRDNPVYVNLDVGIPSPLTGLGPHKDNCDFFRPYFGFQ